MQEKHLKNHYTNHLKIRNRKLDKEEHVRESIDNITLNAERINGSPKMRNKTDVHMHHFYSKD
jgi:hypothetical protein